MRISESQVSQIGNANIRKQIEDQLNGVTSSTIKNTPSPKIVEMKITSHLDDANVISANKSRPPKKTKPKKTIRLSRLRNSIDEFNHINNMSEDFLILVAPMPSPVLNPNKAVSWHARFPHKKEARARGTEMINKLISKGCKKFNPTHKFIQATITIFSNRHIDDDNLESSLKSLRDGIYAGLCINDKLQVKTTRTTYINNSNIIILTYRILNKFEHEPNDINQIISSISSKNI